MHERICLGLIAVIACGSPSAKPTLPPANHEAVRTRAPAPVADKVETHEPAVPAPEVVQTTTRLDLPAVPAFDLPPPSSDGSYSVKWLRVHGAKLLDTKVTVKGVITWRYDCATANRKEGESDKSLQARIDDDPTLCERPKFYVGDSADTPPEKSLWVVDVPRAYNKLELQRIARKERTMPDRCEPNDPKQRLCPPYAVGDEIVIVGDFTLASPHSERNSDGLLVYDRMANLTRNWQSAGSIARPRIHDAAPASQPVQQQQAATPSTTSPRVDDPTNHLGWYRLGISLGRSGDWPGAGEAFEHALALKPDAAMYHLWYGIALYEKAVARAVDPSAINFEKAQQYLEEAVRFEPRLWRAHYYLGRIHRNGGKAKSAAEEFTKALDANPSEPGPYIALAELYRKCDYSDQAIQVAMQGVGRVSGTSQLSDIWYELAMGYDDKRLDDKAIEAFTKALESKPDHAKALFQRGQAYYRKGDFVHARGDLEEFVKTAGASIELPRQEANMMLMNIAAKRGR